MPTRWLVGGNQEAREILFFIHGFPDSPHTFSAQVEFFKNDYLILMPFLRGMDNEAGTEIPKNRYSIDSIVLDFMEIINSHDPDGECKVHIVAHDIGGLFAWQLAGDLGKERATLTAINAPSVQIMKQRLGSFSQLRKSWYIALFQIPGVSESLWKKFGSKLIDKDLQNHDYAAGDVSGGLNLYRAGFNAVLENLVSGQINENLGRVLCISGSKDPYLSVSQKSEVKNLGSEMVMRVLEGGHWLHRSNANKINQHMHDFFRSADVK